MGCRPPVICSQASHRKAWAFASLRQQGGISGFPKPSESEYDAFATGHSSTSISAALGMALARDAAGEDYTVMAVIGDGALGGGMALEAMNHAGHTKTDLIVILNDNEMSIPEVSERWQGGCWAPLEPIRADDASSMDLTGLSWAYR